MAKLSDFDIKSKRMVQLYHAYGSPEPKGWFTWITTLWRHAFKVVVIAKELQAQQIPEEQRNQKLMEVFVESIGGWGNVLKILPR